MTIKSIHPSIPYPPFDAFWCGVLRERGEEAVYMRQEDQKLLNKLLKKERTKSVEDHK